MAAFRPLQAGLGQAPGRPATEQKATSAGRRMLGRRGMHSDAEAGILSRVPKLRLISLTDGTDHGLTEELQGHRLYRPEV
jgi:hypothetical protein